MRVLLLGSPEVLPDFDFIGRSPNLGIASIAGNINDICEVKIADLNLLKKREVEPFLLKTLKKFQPELVGFSCMSFQYPRSLELAKFVKANSSALTAFGGYHPTLMYREIGESSDAEYIDFIIRGEGEFTFRELIAELEGEKRFKNIKGLGFKYDGKFIFNEPRELADLSKIKLPDRTARLLTRGSHAFDRSNDVIETSRGCIQGCKFCSIHQMYGKSFRRYPIDRIMQDIANIKALGYRSIGIADDNITLDLKRLREICDAIIEHGYDDLHYHVQASTRGIARDPEVVRKMAKAGFKMVFLGIENVLSRNLELFNKSAMSIEIEKAVKYLHDNDIIVSAGFILGNPDDDEADLWANFKFARDLKIDLPIFYILTPYPKTELRRELLEMGLIANKDDYSKYTGLIANVNTKHLSARQIQMEVWEMATKFYNFDWVRYNKIKKIYPKWFLVKAFRLAPRYMARKLLTSLKLKTKEDFFEKDLRDNLLYKGYC
ncbi:MAG: radical SAM protein [Methanocellales archaeon]